MNRILRLSSLLVSNPVRAFSPSAVPHCSRQLNLIVLGAQGGRRPSSGGGPPRPGGYRPPGGSRPSGPRPGGPRDFNRDRRGGPPREENRVPMNEAIRAPEVRLMNELKEPLGVMATAEALELAREAGVDLIMIVPDAQPPVCRLVEYSKFNYELLKAQKDAKKKQREAVIETKELKLRPSTDVHDYQVKLRAAQKFLQKGDRVKLSLQFKGREMEFKDIGREMFNRFLEDLEGAAQVEQAVQMQGRQMTMVISPKKEVLPN